MAAVVIITYAAPIINSCIFVIAQDAGSEGSYVNEAG